MQQYGSAAVRQCSSTAVQQYGSAAVRTVVKDRGVQQWGRWYSQAPVGGRHFRNKKKGSSPTGRKRLPRTEWPTHPPPKMQSTLHPPTDQTFITYHAAVQQCRSTYSSTLAPDKKQISAVSAVSCSVSTKITKQITGHPPTTDDAVHPPPTHPPTDQTFTTYSTTTVQQYVQQYTWYAGSSFLVGS